MVVRPDCPPILDPEMSCDLGTKLREAGGAAVVGMEPLSLRESENSFLHHCAVISINGPCSTSDTATVTSMRIMVNTLAASGVDAGGGYTILSNLVPKVVSLDRENDYLLLVTSRNRAGFEVSGPNVKYVVLPEWIHRNPLRLLADNFVVPALAKRHNADVFFSPTDTLAPQIRCASVVGALNLIYHQPMELCSWNSASRRERLHLRLRQVYYRAMTPRAMLRADRVMAISEETRRVVLASVPALEPSAVDVIYPGVPAALFSTDATDAEANGADEPPSRRAPFVLSTSAISPHKNFDKLIEAFATAVRRLDIPHDLVIVGRAYYRSYEEQLRNLAARLGVGDKVTFRGFVPIGELIGLYRTATAFALLSSCESFGFPALEAMAFGAPVIVSNRSSLPEVVGYGGLSVDPDDINAVAKTLGRVLLDEQLRNELSRSGRNRSGDFSWETAAVQLIEVFREVGGRS